MQFSQRLTSLINQTKHTQAELARFVNVKPNTVSDWINKNTSPKIEHLYLIAEFFNVSFNYLMTGMEKAIPNLTNDEQQLLEVYNNLEQDDKIRVYERALTLFDISKNNIL